MGESKKPLTAIRYAHSIERPLHGLESPRQVVPFLMDLLNPTSVLDIGCGLGPWLAVFAEQGITDYFGVDGDYVDRSLLYIPKSHFQAHDLTKPFFLGRTYDLVLSLEVAEHIEEEYADVFVESLARHAETIVFSAAIPGQGGQNHLNEQWPDYWEKKFRRFGFYFHDTIRGAFWDNPAVHVWYQQNIFLLKKEPSRQKSPLSVVHPAYFAGKEAIQVIEDIDKTLIKRLSLKSVFQLFFKVISQKLKKRLMIIKVIGYRLKNKLKKKNKS